MSSSDLESFLPDTDYNNVDNHNQNVNDVAVQNADGETTGLTDGRNDPSYDAIVPSTPGIGGKGGPKGEKGDKKDKKGKSGQKLVSDALKTDMAAERTFFKWLWTGLHTGAIGTFIFVTFDTDKSDPYRLAVVGFAWIVAFSLVLYGLYAYNRRRTALREGRIEILPPVTREYGPYIVVVAVLLVVLSGLLYAVLSGSSPHKGSKSQAFGGV